MRRSYEQGRLDVSLLAATPEAQFRLWLADAVAADLPDPNAMVVSTADASGAPSSRTVLLKGVDERGFTFFTNLGSRKGRELADNPRASLLFPWYSLERQVIVIGTASPVARSEVAAYFSSRPHDSQLGAWASPQSMVVPDREALESAYATVEQRWTDEVPVPEFWGGFRVAPSTVEFWQGRPSRMHDRLRYVRADDGSWPVQRLAP